MFPAARLPRFELSDSLRAREDVARAVVPARDPWASERWSWRGARALDSVSAAHGYDGGLASVFGASSSDGGSASVSAAPSYDGGLALVSAAPSYDGGLASVLPRRSSAPALEPVAPTTWGRALQVMRSWFKPAATAALLGAGLVPSLIGSAGPGQAMPVAPDPLEVAPAATRVAVSAPRLAPTGDRDTAVEAARQALFGAPTRASSVVTPAVGRGGLRLVHPRATPRLVNPAPTSMLRAQPPIRRAELSPTRSSAVAPSLDALGRLPTASWLPDLQPRVVRGSHGPAVERLQERLNTLGYDVGTADGAFGRRTRTAVLEYQFDHRSGMSVDGRVGTATWRTLAAAQARRAPAPRVTPGGLTIRPQYTPFSRDAVRLFEEAATRAHLPRAWASSPGLHRILQRESHGEVGRINYTYGRRSEREVHAELRAGMRTSRSSATGLGQLLLGNVERFYPSGRAGIGDPVEEAVGMLRYIQDRYGNPAAAWSAYGRYHEGY